MSEWEETARADGWEEFTHDVFGLCYLNEKYGATVDNPWCVGSWEELCRDMDYEPNQSQLYS